MDNDRQQQDRVFIRGSHESDFHNDDCHMQEDYAPEPSDSIPDEANLNDAVPMEDNTIPASLETDSFNFDRYIADAIAVDPVFARSEGEGSSESSFAGNLEDEDHVVGNKCQNCERKCCASLNLVIKAVGEIKSGRRRVGALLNKVQQTYFLCESCYVFITTRNGIFPAVPFDFCHLHTVICLSVKATNASVPSRIYSLLRESNLDLDLKRKLVRLIPAEWKSSWQHLVPTLDDDYKRIWHTSGLRDITDNIEEFNNSISSGDLRYIIGAINDYPIESVSVHDLMETLLLFTK
jgi:hypothetical protein